MKTPDRKSQKPIDIDCEINAITRYLEKHWDTEGLHVKSGPSSISPIQQLVSIVVNKGNEAGYAGVNMASLTDVIFERMKERKLNIRLMTGPESKFPQSDGYFFLMEHLMLAQLNFNSASGDGDVAGVVSNLERSCKTNLQGALDGFAGLDTLKPKGYAEFTVDYVEYAGMDTLDAQALSKDFSGHDFSSAGGFPLPEALSLPHIAYDDIDQGRSPLSVLLMRIFYQGVKVREHNNTYEFKRELESLGDPSQPFINHKLIPGDDQPNLRRLLDHARKGFDQDYAPITDESIQEKAKREAEFEALSDEEKRAKKEKNLTAILDVLSNAGGPN